MLKILIQHLPVLLLLFFSHSLVADEFLVVVAKNLIITQMNKQEVERIFRRKTRINKQGKRWVPVNLEINNPLRQAFSKKLFKQSPEAMEAFWNVQYFKGISPPYVVSSEEAVLRFVASTPGAIGYISACHLDSRVHVVLKLHTVENINNLCTGQNEY
jgi:ABC-type phosphate transport system substrate-binding protein